MAPFSENSQLCDKLTITADGHLSRRKSNPISSFPSTQQLTEKDHLPGEPRIKLEDNHIVKTLQSEFMTRNLDKLSPFLWLVAKQDSTHISALTHQIVRGREVIITEDPGLHLVWIYDRVFIKPMPKYLLSHAFWQFYLADRNSKIPNYQQQEIAKAVLGFMRSYAYLIRHKSDFILATNDNHRLLPKKITYSSFVKFITAFEEICDDSVSPRYKFGELRLSRLNFWTKIFLGRLMYHKVHGQYGAYFAHSYGTLLFIFAVFSVLLSAMQVALAVVPLEGGWSVFAYTSRGFAIFTIICVALIIISLLSVFIVLSSREILYAVNDLILKRRTKKVGNGV
ncbi:hypothetical protein CBS147333_8668 [Penicillium roqueforti]|nr:hypothetical protein CBS147332_9520 [Penicillium roqueforti]KAI2709769.1 hypothetical protein CBS147354_8820 [Penicillium roqueforti]KAI3097065.1 hypothetical protein CBS147331_9113 [Penicillium roqueforti]KAI3099928.1 hypothetical protein CBS147333_8668 [Penicillium roqueforti]KAI3120026.1 hypothetical protein CBS147326_9602 [Penicillium roqueforti]